MTPPVDVGPAGRADHPYEPGDNQLCRRGIGMSGWVIVRCGLPASAHPTSKSQLKRLEIQTGVDLAGGESYSTRYCLSCNLQVVEGHDCRPKRLEAQGAGECRSGGHKYEPCTNPEHQTQHCASVEPWGECRALPPTPPTPAGEEAPEIIEDYMPPYPRPGDRPMLVVRCGNSFLRHSRGPKQGHFWDVYGDDYQTVELAKLAISQAPPRHRKPPAPPEADGGEIGILRAPLYCPKCQARHIDEGEWATRPHHKHLCGGCGFVWRVEPYVSGSPSPADGAEGLDAAALRVADGALKALHKRLAEVCGERDEAKTTAAHWKRNWEIATDALKAAGEIATAAESALADALLVIGALRIVTQRPKGFDWLTATMEGTSDSKAVAAFARLKEGGRA